MKITIFNLLLLSKREIEKMCPSPQKKAKLSTMRQQRCTYSVVINAHLGKKAHSACVSAKAWAIKLIINSKCLFNGIKMPSEVPHWEFILKTVGFHRKKGIAIFADCDFSQLLQQVNENLFNFEIYEAYAVDRIDGILKISDVVILHLAAMWCVKLWWWRVLRVWERVI